MDDTTTTTAPTLTYAEAAARWQVSERTIARLVAAGEITTHRKPNDRRRRLISVEEVTAALGPAPQDDQRTETISVAEAVTVLLMAIAFDQPGVYHLLRSQLSGDMLDAVALMVGGEDKLAELDTKAGYTDEGDEG